MYTWNGRLITLRSITETVVDSRVALEVTKQIISFMINTHIFQCTQKGWVKSINTYVVTLWGSSMSISISSLVASVTELVCEVKRLPLPTGNTLVKLRAHRSRSFYVARLLWRRYSLDTGWRKLEQQIAVISQELLYIIMSIIYFIHHFAELLINFFNQL